MPSLRALAFVFAYVGIVNAQLVDLGTALPFAVLAGETVANIGNTFLNVDLGVSPGSAVTGFPAPGVVFGITHLADAVAAKAQEDVVIAYDDAASRSSTPLDLDLGGATLVAGAWSFTSSAVLTGTLTLDGGGNPDSVWIIQIGSTLTTATDSTVVLTNGALACNVFWQVGSSATLGETTTFVGNILALTSITLGMGAKNIGGLYARNGAVTLDNNIISHQPCSVPSSVSSSAPSSSSSAVPSSVISSSASISPSPSVSSAISSAPPSSISSVGLSIASSASSASRSEFSSIASSTPASSIVSSSIGSSSTVSSSIASSSTASSSIASSTIASSSTVSSSIVSSSIVSSSAASSASSTTSESSTVYSVSSITSQSSSTCTSSTTSSTISSSCTFSSTTSSTTSTCTTSTTSSIKSYETSSVTSKAHSYSHVQSYAYANHTYTQPPYSAVTSTSSCTTTLRTDYHHHSDTKTDAYLPVGPQTETYIAPSFTKAIPTKAIPTTTPQQAQYEAHGSNESGGEGPGTYVEGDKPEGAKTNTTTSTPGTYIPNVVTAGAALVSMGWSGGAMATFAFLVVMVGLN